MLEQLLICYLLSSIAQIIARANLVWTIHSNDAIVFIIQGR